MLRKAKPRLESSRHRSIVVLLLVAFILICSTTAAFVQTRRSTTDKGSVPTLHSFSQQPLPRGFFKTWCGMQDRFLMEVDQQLHLFGPDTGSIELPVSEEPGMHCGRDGESVFFNGEKEFVQFDVRARTKDAIIIYQG